MDQDLVSRSREEDEFVIVHSGETVTAHLTSLGDFVPTSAMDRFVRRTTSRRFAELLRVDLHIPAYHHY